MRISEKQIKAVLALSGPERYRHSIKMIADQERVWGLFLDGWALAGDDEETHVFPLWPAEAYAALCAMDHWAGYSPKAITLTELFEWLLPSLREKNTLLAIFKTPSGEGVLPTLDGFEDDLRTELENY